MSRIPYSPEPVSSVKSPATSENGFSSEPMLPFGSMPRLLVLPPRDRHGETCRIDFSTLVLARLGPFNRASMSRQ
ncbi:MAG: hypothetical protein JW888_02785 [Pirellulales bacterium]|nr:hypothetical protein [Pirellulales bacterium]